MHDQDPKLIALRFNEAINERDLDALVRLMTDDHVFIDSAGHRTQGRAEMRAGWSKFFSAFPDYKNVFTNVFQRGDRVIITGNSTCSEPALSGPAIWTASVHDGAVAEWRVYDDCADVRRLLQIGVSELDAGTLIPYLYYEDADAALQWLAKVYGFVDRPAETIRDDAGRVVHAAMNVGAALVMLGCPGADHKNPRRLGQTTQNLYVYVPQLDEHFERTKDQGGEILSPIEATFYGDRRYASADLEGHRWYFAEKLELIAR